MSSFVEVVNPNRFQAGHSISQIHWSVKSSKHASTVQFIFLTKSFSTNFHCDMYFLLSDRTTFKTGCLLNNLLFHV